MSETPSNPEQKETGQIMAIVVPQQFGEPIRIERLPAQDNLANYQGLVGGYVEAVGLEEPAATLFINEESKMNGSQLNARATALLWMHNPAFRFEDAVLGDAFIVGPVDDEGNDLAAPEQLLELIKDQSYLRVEARSEGQEEWRALDITFDDWYQAYVTAFEASKDMAETDELRVVPVEGGQ